MRIFGTENNEVIMKELGIRIKDTRISIELTQRDLAQRAGVSQRTIERVENGENVRVESILNILREMQLLQNLENLIPEQKLRPTELFDNQKKRVRARTKKYTDITIEWEWGDEE